MIKESYERLLMDVTQFDVEDVITTSGGSTDSTDQFDPYELPNTLINI